MTDETVNTSQDIGPPARVLNHLVHVSVNGEDDDKGGKLYSILHDHAKTRTGCIGRL